MTVNGGARRDDDKRAGASGVLAEDAPGRTATMAGPAGPGGPGGPGGGGPDGSGGSPAGGGTRRLRWLLPALLILVWVALGGVLGPLSGKITDVQNNENSAYLPKSSESTKVINLNKKFLNHDTTATVVVYERSSGITADDLAAIKADVDEINQHLGDKLEGPAVGPLPSEDKQAAQIFMQFKGADADSIRGDVKWIRGVVQDTDGLTAHVTGPGGTFADLTEVFGSIDGVLLVVALVVVLLILIAVYRSPLLPIVVLMTVGFAVTLSTGVVYLLAKNDVVTLTGQSQGILDVLVVGATTDYALLLISRYREELRRHASRYDAMRVAWRASVEPIVASAGTVIVGLLCLYLSDLASLRGLGPIGAVGIVGALLAALSVLPAILTLIGRAGFWPFRPHYNSHPTEEHGLWARVAGVVGRRSRVVWGLTALLLVGLSLGMTQLNANGIPQDKAFTKETDSTRGQAVVTAHFPAGGATPAIIVANADQLAAVTSAAQGVGGIAKIVPFTGQEAQPQPGAPAPQPKVVDGLVRLDATLADNPDSAKGHQIIRDLRDAVHAVPGANAKVGGFDAINLDIQDTSKRDRTLIIPVVLAVVLIILMLLLRSVVAPILLVATVVLSFAATLGVSGLVFRHLFDFAGEDASFPLFAFVFLVALGVDYNIFLMTRVREEVAKHGHRAGVLKGLTVTGGVITSAGVVLAATFAALSVMPLVALAEVAFAVSFGVLLDTLIVRSLLVPALTLDIGRIAWWPSKLRRGEP